MDGEAEGSSGLLDGPCSVPVFDGNDLGKVALARELVLVRSNEDIENECPIVCGRRGTGLGGPRRPC